MALAACGLFPLPCSGADLEGGCRVEVEVGEVEQQTSAPPPKKNLDPPLLLVLEQVT